MSIFHTSQPTTAFYPKLGCNKFFLQKLQMLTPVHNDAEDTNNADDADSADNTDHFNWMSGIALLKAVR